MHVYFFHTCLIDRVFFGCKVKPQSSRHSQNKGPKMMSQWSSLILHFGNVPHHSKTWIKITMNLNIICKSLGIEVGWFLLLLTKNGRDLTPLGRCDFPHSYKGNVISLLFSKKDIHGWKIPSKLAEVKKNTEVHGWISHNK